jgi:hypothetical protein
VSRHGHKARFVARYLADRPDARYAAVAQSWVVAGNMGTISQKTFDRVRARLVALRRPDLAPPADPL